MSLTKCISIHGAKTADKIPNEVKIWARNGDTVNASEALQIHIDKLEKLKSNIEKQHITSIADYKEQTINNTYSSFYTGRSETDPKNELNTFQVKSFSKIWKNLVQRFGTFTKAVEQLANSKEGATKEEMAVLTDFSGPDGFGRQMSTVLKKIFKVKGMEVNAKSSFNYRAQDMIQYLVDHPLTYSKKADQDAAAERIQKTGGLDPLVTSAIGATAYEWLATSGRKSTRNSQSGLRRMLSIKNKDEQLPGNSEELLRDTGTDAETLAKQLGRIILQRLNISAGPQSDVLAQSRMEESLGFMAIAAMQEMGIVERQYVIADRTIDEKSGKSAKFLKDNPVGIQALKAGKKLNKEELFIASDDKKGFLTMDLIRVVDVKRMEAIEDKFRPGRKAFDKLFANEPQDFDTSWTAKVRKVFMVGDTNTRVGKEQTTNVNKYNSIPYQRSEEAITFLKSMWDMAENQATQDDKDAMKATLYEMFGAPSAEDLLDLHKVSNESSRRDIEQDILDVMNHEKNHADRVEKGESTDFYLHSDFMANMRMFMRSDINPQNSKIHRSLFAPTGFQTTFKKSVRGKTDQYFLEAIALAFDIETGKKMVGDGKAQVAKLKDLLTNPENKNHEPVTNAIKAIQEFNTTGKMTPELMKTITAGSVAIDNKVTGLKGLFEYARYASLKNGQEFTTDMHSEIDGVSNGVIIGVLQLIPDSAKKQEVLAMLAMGGVSTSTIQENLNKLLIQHNLNDAYQRMADQWTHNIGILNQDWVNSDPELYAKSEALRGVLGSFQDEKGIINSTIRSLSKPRTMQIIFGASTKKQIQLLTSDSVLHEGIYKQVEGIIKRVREVSDKKKDPTLKQDFADLMAKVDLLTGRIDGKFQSAGYMVETSKKETIKRLKAFELNEFEIAELNRAVSDTYGLAMSQAIDTVYGSLIEARKPLNAAVQVSITNYNTILKKKVDLLVQKQTTELAEMKAKLATLTDQTEIAELKEKMKFKTDPERITKADLDTILKSIDHLVPRIKTPLHKEGNGNESYLPMAVVGRNPNYTKQAKVEQEYNSDKLPKFIGKADGIPYLEDAGVAPIIKTIHMLDSLVANGLMSLDAHMLNNHDGFSHGINDSQIIGDKANSVFAKVMTEYSLAGAFDEMHKDLMKKSQIAFKDLGITPNEIIYGTKRNPDIDTLTGGLINDNVINYSLLQSAGLVNEKDKKAYVKKVTGDRRVGTEEYNAIVDQYVQSVIDTQKGNLKDFVINTVFGTLTSNLEKVAEQTTRNKKEITDATTHWSQYPNRGMGVDGAPTNTSGVVFGDIQVDSILTIDKAQNDLRSKEREEIGKKGLASSQTGASTKPQDYTNPAQVIDNKNVVDVFDSLVTRENNMAQVGVKDSPTHIDYLKGVLNRIVAPVMTSVEMFMDEHKINNENQGMWTTGKNGEQIWIQTQQRSTHPVAGMLGQGIRMSTGEIYVHELVHHITHAGLTNFPHLNNQAYALRELAFSEFDKRYGANAFKVFMNNPNDMTDAYEVMAAKARFDYVFNSKRNPDGSHNGLDEFISFGMTNANFKRELGTLVVSDEIIKARKSLNTIFEKNIQQTLVNLFTLVTNFLYKRFNQQRHSTRGDLELENLVRAISYTDSKNKSVLWKYTAGVEEAITALSLQIDEKVIEHVKAAIDKTKIGHAITELKKFPELDNMISHKMRVLLHWYGSQQQGIIPAIVTEMQADTPRLRPLIDMLRMRKHVIDHAKNEAASTTRQVVNEWFDRDLDSTEKSAITKILLKGDVSSLLDTYSLPAILNYISDPAQRDAKIQDILDQIKADPKLKPYAILFENLSDDQAYFMIHSAAKTEHSIPLFNAHNIVAMKDTKHAGKLAGADFVKAVDLVDQLITLQALKYTSSVDRKTVSKLMTENTSAVENVLRHHTILKNQAYNDLFHGKPVHMIKGYTEQILNSQIQLEQASVANPNNPLDPTRRHYEDRGFYMMNTPITRDPKDPVREDIYIFKSRIGAVNDLQPGIASWTQNTDKGVVSYDLQRQIGTTPDKAAKFADQNNRTVTAHALRKLNNAFKPRPANITPDVARNYMVPKFGQNGHISAMRYMMKEHTKDTVLEQFSEFDAILAAMTSQIVDKTVTPKVNQDLIVALKEMADHKTWGLKAQPEAYVEISPWSSEQRYRDIYHQLPPNARTFIKSWWGENRMWVAQDVIDLAFGQRKYSVSETFNKDARTRNMFERMFVDVMKIAMGWQNPFNKAPEDVMESNSRQGNAVRNTTFVYNTLAQLTKLGKSNIVVRNLGVVLGNHNSNMMYLKSMGIPLEKIWLLNKEATAGIIRYQADKQELDALKQKRDIISLKHSMSQADRDIQVRNYGRKISELENRIALNKVTELVNAGAMPSVVDDVETDHVQSPYKYGVDAVLDKGIDMLPKPLQKAGRTLFMTTDTEGFKMMNNAVKLTDFTGRYILYNHLVAGGMDKKAAVSEVMDKFINFDLPTHRMIGVLNDIGLVMFSKYQFRVLKHIKNIVKEHPFTAIATFMLGKTLLADNNIINSIPFMTKDIGQNFNDAITLALTTADDGLVMEGIQTIGGFITPGN